MTNKVMWTFSKVGSVGFQLEKTALGRKMDLISKVLLHCVVSTVFLIRYACDFQCFDGLLLLPFVLHSDTLFEL